MTEEKLQGICYKWAINKYKCLRFGCLFHVPNGGTRVKREAIMFKSIGVVAGIPDMILIHKGVTYGIELKTTTGTVSDKQLKVHQSWKDQGIDTFVIRTFEEFKELVTKIIEGECLK